MANPIRGEAELPIKDREGNPLILAFDVNRMCELESLFPGRNTSDLVNEAMAGSMTVTRAFLWAGLRSYNLNLVAAGEIGQELTPLVSVPLILDAMAKAFPKKQAGGEAGAAGGDPIPAPATGATDGIGKPSSNAGAS